MYSLQGRLRKGLFISLAVIFALLWVVVNGAIRHLMADTVASRLSHDAESLLAFVTFEAEGMALKPGAVNTIYNRAFSGHYFKIESGEESLRSRSLWDADLPVPTVGAGRHTRVRVGGPEGKKLLMWSGGFIKQGRALTICVAEDVSRIDHILRVFQWGFALISFVALVALIIVQSVIVRAGLSPLERARLEALRLERGEIGKIGEAVPAEVRPLVMQINRLLEVANRRLARSRNALGDLAHTLKTPLTMLTRLGESDKVKADPELATELATHTESIYRLMERELRRARLAGASTPGQRFAPDKEIPPLLDMLSVMYRDKNIEVNRAIPEGLAIPADTEDMTELLGTLLDNAFKWAKSRVSLTVSLDNAAVFIIEDDGPGCPEDKLSQIIRRGKRLDESTPGHGLGLAIAGDIVESYGGEITFGQSQSLGGFMAKVTIPGGEG